VTLGVPVSLPFYGSREPSPGEQWRSLYDETRASYHAWYLAEGDAARPSLAEGRGMLARHMPELVPTWERLVDLTDDDPVTARLLTLWNPPAFLPGCSQVALTADVPALIRNYDYRPDLCERVVASTRWSGRRVLGMSDCLWGLLDGMNDAGLAVSLAFGGRSGAGAGFGIPLVVRYLLETCVTVSEVEVRLAGLPVSMAYNLTAVDAHADVATFFVAPGAEPGVTRGQRVATNHRGTSPEDALHARRFASVERQRRLQALLSSGSDLEETVSAMLEPPLHNTAYEAGFGTVYTVAYRPTEGRADFIWPGSRWHREFESAAGVHEAVLSRPAAPPTRAAPVIERRPTGYDTAGVTPEPPSATPTVDQLAETAHAALEALAASEDPQAFTQLIELSRYAGECLGASARNLAAAGSWAGVAQYAGTSRQAAWERWARR
jgi:predicted choloylglycine hydrolase